MKREMKSLEEYVLVFPVSKLIDIGYFQGLSFNTEKYIEFILKSNECKFIKRKKAESDIKYKQLISYCILKNNDKIFTYRRGKLLTEKRLLGEYSIGVGGHITVDDPTLFGISYKEGLKREIKEEIGLINDFELQIVALLNDDSNDVGKVHFGIVCIIGVDNKEIFSKEKSINEPKFLSVSELKRKISKFENWSKICINEIEELTQIK